MRVGERDIAGLKQRLYCEWVAARIRAGLADRDAAARAVDEILRVCTHVKILATSRELLGVVGEATWSRVTGFSRQAASSAASVPEVGLPPSNACYRSRVPTWARSCHWAR